MARASLAVLLISLIAYTGCAQPPTMTAHVPPPRLDGGKIARPAPVVTRAPVIARSSTPPAVPASWIPQAPARPWRWIVIHHSATSAGGMAMFDREHKAKGWDGVGYHFVIGNGTQSGDG